MPRQVIKGAAGLMPSISDLVAPDNKLFAAENVEIRDTGVIEPRLGLVGLVGSERSTGASADFGPISLFQYGNTLYCGGNPLAGPMSLAYWTGSAWSNVSMTDVFSPFLGSINPSGTYPVVEMLQNAYFNAAFSNVYDLGNYGLFMLDTEGGSSGYVAGFRTPSPITGFIANKDPAVILPAAGVSATGAWAWASNTNGKAAYRVVWGRKDAHKRVILSAPSARSIYNNVSGANASIYGDVPAIPECSSSTFYQVYRSASVDCSTVTTAVPSDDMYLVYEGTGCGKLTVAAGGVTRAAGPATTVVITSNAHGLRLNSQVYVSYASGDTDANEFTSGTYRVSAVTTNTFSIVGTKTGAYTSLGATTITPVSFPFFDYSPDTILNNPLYTNPIDGDGLGAANDKPPMSETIAGWKGRLWFGNTKKPFAFKFRLLGVTGNGGGAPAANKPDGLTRDDTITFVDVVGTQTYTAKASPTTAVQFAITDTSTTPSINIDTTSRALVAAINANPANTSLSAYYVSGDNDFPGEIVVIQREYWRTGFTTCFNRTEAWTPFKSNNATAGSNTATHAADNEAYVNRLYYSKPNQPEAVPELQYIDVGAGNKAVIKIAALKDALLVFKEDGIFSVTGDYPFRVDLLDGTATIRAKESVVAGDSAIYGLFNLGFCRISSQGVSVISSPIASYLRAAEDPAGVGGILQADLLNAAVLDELGGRYLVTVYQQISPSVYDYFLYCYNIRTKTWTRHSYRNAVEAHPNGLSHLDLSIQSMCMYKSGASKTPQLCVLGSNLVGTLVFLEQAYCPNTSLFTATAKRFKYCDGIFGGYTKACSTFATASGIDTITVGTAWSYPQVGDILYYLAGATNFTFADTDEFYAGLITAVSADTKTFTCVNISGNSTTPTTANTLQVLFGYKSRAAYDVASPETARHYRDATLYFMDFKLNNPSLIVVSDQNSTETPAPFSFSDSNVVLTRGKRVLWPALHQYANGAAFGIQNAEAGCYFKLIGASITYENVSERNSR